MLTKAADLYHLSIKRTERGGWQNPPPHDYEGQEYPMTNRVNRFRMFAKRATLTLDKALVAVMVLLSSHNLLSLKSRDSLP